MVPGVNTVMNAADAVVDVVTSDSAKKLAKSATSQVKKVANSA